MQNLFEAFVRERRYARGVSARTEVWYHQSWNAFESALTATSPEALSRSTFIAAIEELISRGVKPVTVNTYARAINAFLRSLHDDGHLSTLLRIPKLKEPEVIVATFRPEHVHRLLECRPDCHNRRRARVLALLILDTGLRLREPPLLRPLVNT